MPLSLINRRKALLQRAKKKPCFKMVHLLFGALPTIVFGVFTIVFTQQQNAASQAAREQDQRQADENNQRILFKEYIDDIKELLVLVDGQKMKNETLLIHIRVRTLTVLKSLDAARKRDIILFLYESRLLDHAGDRRIDLHGANLNGVRFEKSLTEACNLGHLYLPGIFGEGMVFDGCAMTHAVFDNAAIPGATFSSCMLDTANFSKANLKGAQFHENMLSGSSFYGSDLTRSRIRGSYFDEVNLSNADLYQSDISDGILFPSQYNGTQSNSLTNARLPNGSFIVLNTKNLFVFTEGDLPKVRLADELVVPHITFLSVASVLTISRRSGHMH